MVALTTDFERLLGHPVDRLSVEGMDVEGLDRSALSSPGVLGRLVARAGRFDAVVVDGSTGLRRGYVDLLAAGIMARRRKPLLVVVADATWKRGSWWADRGAGRLAIKAVDRPNVIYCVHSTEETRRFPETWGVDPSRVEFVPWGHILTPRDLAAPSVEPGGVFAGGDSLRDYEPLIEAARGLPTRVTIATRSGGRWQRNLPSNVTAGPVRPETFTDLMRRSRAVVVPVRGGIERSAGQTVFLNAMALGKPVVVTDSFVARDYVEDGRTGIIVPPGDPGSLRRALEWVLDPANEAQVAALGARASEVARTTFSPRRYLESMLRVVATALEARGTSRAPQM